MWMFFHRWFGWDYVYIKNAVTSRVIRVKVSPNGRYIFLPHPFQEKVIDRPLPREGKVIEGWVVVPLTYNVTTYKNWMGGIFD
jgi:hypothetical protein